MECILKCRGRVFALQDKRDVHRVWLPNDDAPSLAMARVFGDFYLKNYGVISVPEVSYRLLNDRDQFIVLASDGVGMSSALETLCGQAYGAGKLDMLGVYMQRSWIILIFTAILFLPVCIFASPILKLLGQDDEIADLAGKVSIWMIPQSFSYVFNFANQKFLQAQSKVMVVAFIFAGVCAIRS